MNPDKFEKRLDIFSGIFLFIISYISLFSFNFEYITPIISFFGGWIFYRGISNHGR